jgi:gluconate 5-dehydrogenase
MGKITPVIEFSTELADLFDVNGKVAYLPGGYGGIGEAIAWGLAIRGAKVAVSGRNQEKAEKLASQIRASGHSALGVHADVQSVADIKTSVDQVVRKFGPPDILVNCVGIQREEPLLEVTEDAFDEVYRSNLKSAMFVAQTVARYQTESGIKGKQVHLLSVRARLGLRDRGYSAYCSTKGEFKQQLLERIPLGRIADPKDIVGAVLFFCSPASDFITGQILYADGGITASQ